MKYTQIPENTFKELQMNAGVIVKTFDPEVATVTGVMYATSGGINFSAVSTYKDLGADIDNCPKNTAELKQLESWEIKLSGTAATVNPNVAKSFIAAADVSGNKVTPRNDLNAEDFEDIWWIGDYSEKNSPENGGFVAIHMMKALSTGGFSIQSSDKEKGKFAFEYTAHYSISAQSTPPFEVYIKAGGLV